ncbi:GNAT family N-acetyltransferase [candidate division KSB1 bacterium]|nr:GNAT family N-acetyltransferase [candidate division KSB1 bacterium]
MDDTKIIETKRMYARKMVVEDADILQTIFSDPNTMKFFDGTKTKNETLEWIDTVLESYEQHGFGLWNWFSKKTADFLGYCGFIVQPEVDGKDEIEIAYSFVRKYWNKGLATEAAVACRDYGFSQYGITRFISLVEPENIPSRRVAEKNCMKVEKMIQRWGKEFCLYAVNMEDVYRFAAICP